MRQVLGPGALGRPRGIGWRGRWERGSGWGIHVTPWLIHVSVWQNPLQCCEVISLQLIKINEKKKINKKNKKEKRKLYLLNMYVMIDNHWEIFTTIKFISISKKKKNLGWTFQLFGKSFDHEMSPKYWSNSLPREEDLKNVISVYSPPG